MLVVTMTCLSPRAMRSARKVFVREMSRKMESPS
jgi:hypothetical protein